jgi:hypothetical protein
MKESRQNTKKQEMQESWSNKEAENEECIKLTTAGKKCPGRR